jgi:hypothetical protein
MPQVIFTVGSGVVIAAIVVISTTLTSQPSPISNSTNTNTSVPRTTLMSETNRPNKEITTTIKIDPNSTLITSTNFFITTSILPTSSKTGKRCKNK